MKPQAVITAVFYVQVPCCNIYGTKSGKIHGPFTRIKCWHLTFLLVLYLYTLHVYELTVMPVDGWDGSCVEPTESCNKNKISVFFCLPTFNLLIGLSMETG